MKTLKIQKGISLLEVIIAFAITSILVAATMPNFQDYTVRGRVIEALRLAEPAEMAGGGFKVAGVAGLLALLVDRRRDAILDLLACFRVGDRLRFRGRIHAAA